MSDSNATVLTRTDNDKDVTHGVAKIGGQRTPEYAAYHAGRIRCNKSGGRLHFLFTSFQQFYAKLGPRPEDRDASGRSLYCLERIDRSQGYSPDNCEWRRRLSSHEKESKLKAQREERLLANARRKATKQEARRMNIVARTTVEENNCVVCGTRFSYRTLDKAVQKHCSKKCRTKRHRVARRHIRRARQRGAEIVEAVDIFACFARDGWICQICKQPAPRELYGLNLPLSPEAEHEFALGSFNGNHTSANVRCAHRVCNNWKLQNVDRVQRQLLPQLYEVARQELQRLATRRVQQVDSHKCSETLEEAKESHDLESETC